MSRHTIGAAAAAAWGLRAHRGTSALLSLVVTLAVAAAVPAVSFGAGWAPTLHLPWIVEPEATGLAFARTPAWLRHEEARLLFAAFFGASAATFAVGALGVLLLWGARSGERAGEMVIRQAVGASRRALFGAAILEGAAVAAAALALGLPAGLVLARGAAAAWPGTGRTTGPAPIALLALATALIVLAGAALAFVFAPRRRLTDAESRPLGLAIPCVQLGLALVILVGGALMSRTTSLAARTAAGGGGTVYRGTAASASAAARATDYAALLEAVRTGGAYDTVSLTGSGSVVGLGTVGIITTDCGLCRFGGLMVPQHSVPAAQQFVSADSFQALGVRLVAGRGITDADDWHAGRVVVVSRALARLHFQNGEAIGRRLLLGDDPRTWYTVVGVVDTPPAAGLGATLLPTFTVYASVLQHPPRAVELLVRPRQGVSISPADGARVARALGIAAGGVERTDEAALLAGERAPVAWFARLFAVEGWITLLLAVLGTVVQVSLWVRSLGAELGLRRALGAARGRIFRLVLSRAALVGAGGIAVGLCLGPAVWGALGTVVGGLPAWDGALVGGYGALLVASSTLAAVWPAWRAVRRPPAALLASA